ncbi:MAG TPA: L,D-transpeptidase, partial [Flavobacteriales bacterium]|nr:L,D-transpeptidase [Flavobacteriales bacterium]
MRSLLVMLLGGMVTGSTISQPADPMEHPKQGLIDLLMEYLEVRYPGQDLRGDLLYISIERQALFHVRGGRLIAAYPVATARAGLGSELDSYRTPAGLHRVTEKIGDDVPPLGILRDREFTGAFADPDFAGVDRDWITSRILWLSGLEPGVNQGGKVDSHERFIYIHGTANERSVGTPSSMGCVRMRN